MNPLRGCLLALLACTACLADSQALDRACRSVVEVLGETAPGQFNQGSGVVVSEGLIASNAHVLRNVYKVSVVKDGRTWEVDALCVSPEHDLVLLRIPGLPLAPVDIASEADLKEGQPLVSLGYPGGRGPTLGRGTLLSFWAWKGGRILQTDARIRPGSSGGGLFTEDGRLVGITTFFLSDNQRLSFAIPGEFVASLEKGGPTPAGFRCPVLVPDRLILDIQDLVAEDPRNLANWDALTRQWVADAPQDAKAWFARGTALDMDLRANPRDAGTLDQAAESYRRAVTLNPDHARAWNNLGSALDLQNRFKEAQAAFRKAIALQPAYALAWINLGASLINAGNFPEAADALEHGTAMAPDNPEAWARLAFCEARLRRWGLAADHYQVALRYDPFRAEWWGERYLACRALRRQGAAQEALEKVRALAPALAEDLQRQR